MVAHPPDLSVEKKKSDSFFTETPEFMSHSVAGVSPVEGCGVRGVILNCELCLLTPSHCQFPTRTNAAQ